MAKKNHGGGKEKARGLLSDPRQGRFEGAPRDRGANPQVRLGKERFGRRSKYPGVSQDQRAILNQMEANDLALGDMSQAMMPGIQRTLEQPWDNSELPQSPWAQFDDVKGMQDHYYDEVYGDFARQAEPEFEKQATDFETSMVQRGIPIGSELYNDQKKQLLDAQGGQRQSMRTQALSGAGSYASQWQDMGRSNYFDARGVQTEDRYRPLTEFGMLTGARSGMAPAALQQSWDRQNAKWALANQPRGGGGGGGGGTPPYGGFGSQQAYWDAQDARNRANAEWEMELNRRYAPKQPRQAGWQDTVGRITGAALSGWASGGFKW